PSRRDGYAWRRHLLHPSQQIIGPGGVAGGDRFQPTTMGSPVVAGPSPTACSDGWSAEKGVSAQTPPGAPSRQST
ncbi:MAG TPA: hypothetical protein VHM23_05795, partial [Actinomycetota bacterium]|nr:hypothetical protein [Actinomycetota bacterium]